MVRTDLRAYGLLVWTQTRAAAQYPASLVLLTLGAAVLTGLDVVAILVMFAHTDTIATFTLAEVMFLYGTSSTSFALSDLLMGQAEKLGRHVRAGTFDIMLLRPVGAWAQLCGDGFAPRQAGKLVQAGTVLGVAIAAVDVDWTAGRIAMVPVMIVSGVVIYGAVWALGAAFQFLVTDAAEVMNAFTYGGSYLTQYPLSIYARDLVRAVTWVIPLAFVNWQPALFVLDRPDPLGLPDVFRFASPLVALAFAVAAGAGWRAGLRRYKSTGS